MKPAPASSREKRIKFIQSYGSLALHNAIMEAIARIGEENFLTDEQLADITQQQVRDARQWNRNLIRYRRAARCPS